MTDILKFKTFEVSLSSANSVANSQLVRVYNPTASDVVATIAYSNGTSYANCTLIAKNAVLVQKEPTDTVAATGVLGVGVAFENE